MTGLPLLSLIVFSPLVGALIVQLLPEEPVRVPRIAAFVVSLVPFVLALLMLAQFDPSVGTLQLRERVAWIPQLGVDYAMGVDGFSLWLILLTTFLTPVVILAAWTDITDRVRPSWRSCWCSSPPCWGRCAPRICSSSSSSGSSC